MSSISKLQEHKGFRQSWKLWRNLCSLRWLSPNRRRVSNFKPFGSKILYMLLWTGRIKDNSLRLKTSIDSWCILSDVVVVHIVIHFRALQFPNWWKSNLWQQQESQAANLPANFEQNILFGPFQLYELSSFGEIWNWKTYC